MDGERAMAPMDRLESGQPPGATAVPVPGRLPPRMQPEPAPANAVVYALVVALLDLEQRRDRGKVRRPMARNAAR
jgi:hypothetical protein